MHNMGIGYEANMIWGLHKTAQISAFIMRYTNIYAFKQNIFGTRKAGYFIVIEAGQGTAVSRQG